MGAAICYLAWRTKLGSFHEPGAGFVAFFVGLFIGSIGAIIFFLSMFSKTGNTTSPGLGSSLEGISWLRISYAMALLVLYSAVLDHLGYLLTTFFMMFGLFYDWETKRWFPPLFASFVTTIVTYLVFDVWLHCQLPRGILAW